MPSQDDIERRLKVVLNDKDNQSCSECDREENTPIWACFLVSPVDKKRLGVVCCKKCVKLFKKVDGAHFDIKDLKNLKDWTGDDIEALELGGNKLVNSAYEATVTNEKNGREKRKYGYEAFFFEKYVNLAYLDEIAYKNHINQASKALVEKRFNQNLRGYNLKKIANEDDQDHSSRSHHNNNDDDYSQSGGESDYDSDHGDHDEDANYSNEEEEEEQVEEQNKLQAERERRRRSREGGGLQRGNSSRGIRNRRAVSARAQSARNLRVNSGGGVDSSRPSLANTRPSLSRRRMDSLRRDLMEERENGRDGGGSNHGDDNNNTKGRMRRRISARNLRVPNDDNEGGGGERGLRRGGSNRRLERQGSREEKRGSGMRRASSNSRLNSGVEERERRHGRRVAAS